MTDTFLPIRIWCRNGLAIALVLGRCSLSYGNPQDAAKRPAPRFHHSAVYDASRKQFLIYGGYVWKNQKPTLAGDVWGWDGQSWLFIADTGLDRMVPGMAYDSKRRRTVSFGGMGSQSDGTTRELVESRWSDLDNSAPKRSPGAFVYDSKRDRLVMFGGLAEGLFFSDTWEFDGQSWSQAFVDGPSLRTAIAAAYDSSRGVTVLYGGFRPLKGLGDTWEYDGKAWKLASTSGPGARSFAGMAYDSKRKRIILYGGEDQKGKFYGDTWSWDGKKWRQIDKQGPPPRIQFAMDYDSVRDRVIVFGGVSPAPQFLGDLWEFDGRKWIKPMP